MTAPLVPADVDLRGYEYMPLYGHYLFGSGFNAKVSDEAWRAAVTLWWKAWIQVPAASLPDDDVALTRLAELGKDVKAFRKIKAEALHGFIRCDDDRLYHPRLAVWALEAWERRLEHAESSDSHKTRQQRWRDRCKQLSAQLRECGVTPPRGASLETLQRLLETSQASTKSSTSASTVGVISDGVEIGKEVKGSEGKGKEVPNRDVELNVARDPPTPSPHGAEGQKGAVIQRLNVKSEDDPPWWKSAAGVDATGQMLGMLRRTGESDAEWKDRVYMAVEAKRAQALSQGKQRSGGPH